MGHPVEVRCALAFKVFSSSVHLTSLVQWLTALLMREQTLLEQEQTSLEQQTQSMNTRGVRMWIQKLTITTSEKMKMLESQVLVSLTPATQTVPVINQHNSNNTYTENIRAIELHKVEVKDRLGLFELCLDRESKKTFYTLNLSSLKASFSCFNFLLRRIKVSQCYFLI